MFRERNMMDDPLVVDIILGSGVLKFGDIALCYGLNTTWKDALSERVMIFFHASLLTSRLFWSPSASLPPYLLPLCT